MTTLWKHPVSLFFNYSILGLFTLGGLFSTPFLSNAWWGIVILALTLGTLLFFWPVEQRFYYPYLITEAVLILGLTALNANFMFIGFNLSVHAAILLPRRPTFAVIGAFWLGLFALQSYRYGWAETLFTNLSLLIGFAAVAVAYSEREQAEKARRETQQFLDDLREAHHRLETYAAQAQELAAVEERNRIARELHDTVKQQAFAVSGQLGAARSLLSGERGSADLTRATEHLRTAEVLMDEIRTELGQLIHALRPVALEDQGLAATLRGWCSGWSQQSGIAIDVRVQGERRLALETEQALFRIAQEALSNVARHSQASRAEVCLDYSEDGQIALSISDNGRGFDLSHSGDGIGLRTMRERADRLNNGEITIKSSPGKGSRIVVRCSA